PTVSSTTRRSPTTGSTADGKRCRLDRLDRGGVRVHLLGDRGRVLLEPVLLGAGADREPRLVGGALPAALGRVRRGGTGTGLRGRGDGHVPLRDRVPGGTGGRPLGRRTDLAADRRGARGRRDPRRGARRHRAQARRDNLPP